MMTHRDFIPDTTERVAARTAGHVNRRIAQQMEASVARCADRPDRIARRLAELDREWDVERALEANAASLALCGVLLGVTADRRFLALPALVTAFLLQHAVQGWCPPLPVLRRLGIRTATEIARERYALKYLRGDFGEPPAGGTAPERARRALAAAH